jgi:hypothetical protein
MTTTATNADVFKKAYYEAVKDTFASDPDKEHVLVTFGAPGTYTPQDIVSFLDVEANQDLATLGTNRGRDETIDLTVSISCLVPGGQEAELLAHDRAYTLLRAIEYYARRTDTTVGGTVRHCFCIRHGSAGQTDPTLIERGRVCEIVAVFRAVARVTN